MHRFILNASFCYPPNDADEKRKEQSMRKKENLPGSSDSHYLVIIILAHCSSPWRQKIARAAVKSRSLLASLLTPLLQRIASPDLPSSTDLLESNAKKEKKRKNEPLTFILARRNVSSKIIVM